MFEICGGVKRDKNKTQILLSEIILVPVIYNARE